MQAFYDLDVVDRRALKCRSVLHIRPICLLVRIALCKQFAKFNRLVSRCPNLIKASAAQFSLFQFVKLIIPECQFSDRTCLRPYDHCGFPRFCCIVRVIRYIDRADRTAFPLAQIQRSFHINSDNAAIHRRFITAFADNFQGAGCVSLISIFTPDIKPAACDFVFIQIQRNRCIVAGNTRSVRNRNIRQQGDFCAVCCILHRLFEIGGIGNRITDFHLGNHFCVAVRANAVIAYIFVRAMVATDGADAVYQHRLFIAQVSVCVASAAVAVGNAIRFIMGIAACVRPNAVCVRLECKCSGVSDGAICFINGIAIGYQFKYRVVDVAGHTLLPNADGENVVRCGVTVGVLRVERAFCQKIGQLRVAEHRQTTV